MNKKKEKTIEDLRAYSHALEQSSEYLKILPEVMKEVYTLFVKEEIERSEAYLAREEETDDPVIKSFYNSQRESTEKQINEAKRLLPDDPEQAAQVFMQLGSCHRLWDIQKTILKEKYGITWYSPDELNPEIIYD
jgi:hypothetical protein